MGRKVYSVPTILCVANLPFETQFIQSSFSELKSTLAKNGNLALNL